MFKLESYITPWLLSYIDQYVKLRREDFQLSLWGGDVVFYNLELRLANIQKLVPTLPIIFQSGIIHELRIHIPWIRITSEPIVVTINQIELVIVLNKERTSANDSPLSFPNEINSDPILLQQQQPTTPEQSNYVQTVLARILNNVHIIVNNLIIKFVEDDIVISLSSRTAECYAVNQNWLRSFIELTQQDLSLRRLITLPDLTLCLDKRDLNGKVHRYEVPLLSRCSFECRIQMLYYNVYQQLNTKPIQTRLSFNCANIEVSIVDNQFSMLMRLIEMIMLVVNQQIHSNENEPSKEQKKIINNDLSPPLSPIQLLPPPPPLPLPPPLPSLPPIVPPKDADNAEQGWASWAWSYIPSVTTLFVEDDPPIDSNGLTDETQVKKEMSLSEQNPLISNNDTNINHTPTPILFAGIDLDRISLQYKITKSHGDKSSSLVPFIAFIVEKANIIVERFKPTSTTAVDGQSVVTRVRKLKVSTSKMSLIWDERLSFSLSDVHFTLHYDRHVRMTHFSLTINDLNARLDNNLLIYPCQATLKLDHHRTYSLLHLEFSSLTGKLDFNILAYLINVINQIRSIVEIAITIFRPSTLPDPIDNDIISVDDLRNGSMKCIFQSTNDLPNTNEIFFTTTHHHNIASCMTWKYPQRRSLLKCHILPLPFDDDLNGAVTSQRAKTVDCLMQYWHFGTKQFVTWQTFDLSDGQPLFLDFSNDLGHNPYSEMWRIVLVNASSIINQANSLAASTRIDSLQSQRYEPSIEMTIKIPNIRLHFVLDVKENFSTTFQSILHGCQHDVATLNFDNLSFDLSQRLETKLISIETIVSLETLEYRFLTKRSCIEPVLINLDLFIDTSKSSILTSLPDIFDLNNGKYNQLFRSAKTSIVYQLHFDIDHINIRISQSLCHLINILYQNFIRSDMIKLFDLNPSIKQVIKTDDTFYYTYYLFTNHLNYPVGLKQSKTIDKYLVLPSSRTTDFVWSKLNTDQLFIQFSLDSSSSDSFYSLPIDIHHSENNIKQIVQFENSPYSFYLQIYYDEHHIRRHIHILGKLIFKNLSNFDLNLKLYLNLGSREIDLFLSKNQSYLSCLQTIEDIGYIQWNSSIKYSIDQLNQDGILSTSEQTSIWIHLIHSENFYCFIFTPIVIYRSYLTQSVFLHLNKQKSFLLPSNGLYTYFNDLIFENSNQNYEHRLQQIDAEQITETIFQLNKQSYLSLNQIENIPKENSSLIDYLLELKQPHSSEQSLLDLLRHEHLKSKRTDDDIPIPLIEQTNEILNASLIPTIGANGPAMYEPQLPIPIKKIHPIHIATNSIDCRIEPIRLYSHLNTILIQLKPSTLINNLTPFNFYLYANAGHDHVYIHSEQLTCLSKFDYSQLQFILIDPNDGEHIQCQTIDLIFRNISMMNSTTTILNNRLYTNNSIDLYFIKSSNNDYFIIHIKHEYLDHTHILTIQSKYRIFNHINQGLICSILPISKQQYTTDYPFHSLTIKSNEYMNLYRFQGIPSTDMIYYLLFQFDTNDKQYLSKPIQLIPGMDENDNRQCFCLFHKDEQIKSKSSSLSFQSYRGELFSVNQSLRSPTNQIDISIQSNPSWAFIQVINACSYSLLCRLENVSSMSHIIPPFSSTFIGIDSAELSIINANHTTITNNNNIQNLMNGSRFYLAQFNSNENFVSSIQLITNYFKQITTKIVQWSRPIRIDSHFEDVFLPVPGLHDVLIRSVPVTLSASRTLIIEPVQRQRSSKTMITQKSEQTIKRESSFPNTTLISETIPRQYRSNIFEKAPLINSSTGTNQYLKSWQQQYNQGNHRQVQLNFLINKISLSLMDELNDVCLFREILRITIDKMNLLFYQHFIDIEPCLYQQQFFCSIDQLQMDNQCFSSKNNFDFPVILMSKDETRVSRTKTNIYERKEPTGLNPPFADHHRQNSSSSVDTTATEDPFPAFDSLTHNHKITRPKLVGDNQPKFLALHFHRINERFIKIDFQIQSFDVYLEDHYIYFLLKIFSHLLPLDLNIDKTDPRIENIENQLMQIPFVCESLNIGTIDIVISVHASLKVYIGCHQLPIFIDKFHKNSIYSSNKQLLTLITRHYLLSLLTRSPLLIGSFDLLGNPSVFIRNITDGIYDLFHLPYVGMSHGPSGFMMGISEGATSLLKHFSLGTLTSLTTFANSVARNMDRLAMDSEHTSRTEETCRHIPTGMTSGLLQGLELFSLSLLGAIAGLAEQPLASFRNRDDSQPATTTVLSGVGKGLVGIVAKPVGGVAQLISQTGQGILYGTGLMNIPHRRHRQLEQDARINTNISHLKLSHICQITQNQDEILDILDYVLEHHIIEHGILILTKNGHVIVYHKDDENQHSDYLLNDIEISESPDSSGLLVFNNLSFYVDPRLRHQFLALCRLIRS